MPTAYIQDTLVSLGVAPSRARQLTIELLRRVANLGATYATYADHHDIIPAPLRIEDAIAKAITGEPQRFLEIVEPFSDDIGPIHADIRADMVGFTATENANRRAETICRIIDDITKAAEPAASAETVDTAIGTVLDRLADADIGTITVTQHNAADWTATLTYATDYQVDAYNYAARGDTFPQAIVALADQLNTDVA